MLKSVTEFKSWGLSKLAIRNIIVFFILAQMTAIAWLAKYALDKDNDIKLLQSEIISAKQATSDKIEQIKNENARDLRLFNEVIQKQLEIQQRLNEASRELQKLRRNK